VGHLKGGKAVRSGCFRFARYDDALRVGRQRTAVSASRGAGGVDVVGGGMWESACGWTADQGSLFFFRAGWTVDTHRHVSAGLVRSGRLRSLGEGGTEHGLGACET
jgi:hypothetical protein